MMLEMLRQGSLRDREVRAKKADGSPIWIAASSEKMTFNGVPGFGEQLFTIWTNARKPKKQLRQQAAELLARKRRTRRLRAHSFAQIFKSPLSIISGLYRFY